MGINFDKILISFISRAQKYVKFQGDYVAELKLLFSLNVQKTRVNKLRDSLSGMNLNTKVNKLIKSLPNNSVVTQAAKDCAVILNGFVSLVSQIDLLYLHLTNEASSSGPVSHDTFKIYNAWLAKPFKSHDAANVFDKVTKMQAMHKQLTQNFVRCLIKVQFFNEKYKIKSDAFICALQEASLIENMQATQDKIRTAIASIYEIQNQIITELSNANRALTDFYAKREYFARILMGEKIH